MYIAIYRYCYNNLIKYLYVLLYFHVLLLTVNNFGLIMTYF